MKLTRYWFEFETKPFGYGVTAYSREDALEILRQEAFAEEVPPLSSVVEDVDVSKLDPNHVLPNMMPPNWRGMWFPPGYQRFSAKPS